MTIRPGSGTGHCFSGRSVFPADVDFINRETSAFLDAATDGGKKLD
jgi:homoserine O-acetyltransferase